MKECPKCGCRFVVLDEEGCLDLRKLNKRAPEYSGRKGVKMMCLRGRIDKVSSHYCDQRFWYYPETSRITRRLK